MKAAIIGASGYSGEELVRLLSRHPDVTLNAVTSRSLAGKLVAEQMPALQQLVGKLTFTGSDTEELAANPDIDLFFRMCQCKLTHIADNLADEVTRFDADFDGAISIDELKAQVPIWKKEIYEDGTCWKANKESGGGVG